MDNSATYKLNKVTVDDGYPAESRPACTRKQLNLLIVDDSLMLTNKIKELLKCEDFVGRVSSCSTYKDALSAFFNAPPDIALLDLNISGESGLTLLKILNGLYPQVDVIIMSNHEEEHYQKLCVEMGAKAYLDKSKNLETLSAVIEAICSKL